MKLSVAEAKKARAIEEIAAKQAALFEQMARIEAKLDSIIEALAKPEAAKPAAKKAESKAA